MNFIKKWLITRYELPDSWDSPPLPDGLRLVDVRDFVHLAEHADAWDELLLKSNLSTPMVSYAFLSAYLEHQLEPGESWLCLLAYDGDELAGVLPLVVRKRYRFLTRSLVLFKLPYNPFHTDGVDCLTLPGREDLLEVFVDYLARIPKIIPFVSFKRVPEHSSAALYANRENKKVGLLLQPAGYQNTVRLPESYEAYYAGMSANFRRYLKKNTKKLEKLQNVSFRIYDTSRPIEENVSSFMEVEDRNWKGKGQSSIKARPADEKMLTQAARGLHERGWMIWNFLEADGKIIAGQYAVRIKQKLNLLKIGFDEDYGFCSPGNLLIAQVIEHAFNSGDIDEVDMMADLEWHLKWQVYRRPFYNLLVFPKNFLFEALSKLGVLHCLNKLLSK